MKPDWIPIDWLDFGADQRKYLRKIRDRTEAEENWDKLRGKSQKIEEKLLHFNGGMPYHECVHGSLDMGDILGRRWLLRALAGGYGGRADEIVWGCWLGTPERVSWTCTWISHHQVTARKQQVKINRDCINQECRRRAPELGETIALSHAPGHVTDDVTRRSANERRGTAWCARAD